MTLTLSLAYYHRRWKLRIGGANAFLDAAFFCQYLASKILGSLIGLSKGRARIPRSTCSLGRASKDFRAQWDGDIEDELIKNLAEDMDSNFTWKDRVTWLCFASGAILLLILKTARRRLISKERPCRIRWRIERVLTLRQREGQP